jgi:hypothetical protein
MIVFYPTGAHILEDLVTPYRGTAFPSDVKTTEWSSGRVTALPFITCAEKDNFVTFS